MTMRWRRAKRFNRTQTLGLQPLRQAQDRHIPQHFAGQVNAFTTEVLSPYLNFHRPCHFPTEYTDKKGRIRKRYRYQDMMTPYEKLKSLPKPSQYLKPGGIFKQPDAIAAECSDNDAAQRLNQARTKLFQLINKTQQRAA